MFCDACGTELGAGQQFCSRCGKKVVAGTSLAYPQPGRVQEHIRLLGILWLAVSALNAVAGAGTLVVANAILPHLGEMGGPPVAEGLLRPIGNVFAFYLLAKAVLGFAAGWACCNANPGHECSRWCCRFLRYSMFRSGRRWEFIRCGFCCPDPQRRNTREWRERPERGCLYSGTQTNPKSSPLVTLLQASWTQLSVSQGV